MPVRRGLGGRASPRPAELTTTLSPGDRLILCSDGVFAAAPGQAGLGHDGVAHAALQSEHGSAADTVRKVHRAVLQACGDALRDDATVVCLAAE
jgi:serine phosphatase RsbU (regulator of sigma subunit)